ncbi:lipocalin-like domain-containing protein [Denitromonas halophila]|uniref:Carotenoid 1,2-hydratase n=1 Tax=Denitromonas halophila TaxID=1629404 RepID=A0A557QW87_9RHOO|nr:lipocalin-like domain-containing protein [Denitromonas halophila]TVO57174.1 carotenoid 1,2-hydratase [Denitromonas halophila]
MTAVFLLALALLIGPAAAQGDPYQVLRSTGEGYATVVPGRAFSFPADHLPHPDYRIEWWYLTANLKDANGRDWGLQWTLFRQAMSPTTKADGWDSNQIWMAHAAITTPDGHRHEQRFARGGIGQADVRLENGGFSAWLDDWSLVGEGPDMLPGRLRFTVGEAVIDMHLASDTPPVLQGKGGYSQKSAQGQASYYYSQPHIAVSGTVVLDGQPTALTGAGWLDREWSSQPLADNQQGWDWFSLHLADGHALMVYRLRHADGQHWLSGSWVAPDGTARTLVADEIALTVLDTRRVRTPTAANPEATRDLPLTWRVSLPGLKREWTVRALIDDQWMGGRFPYWEGVVLVDEGAGGVGFLELTGYGP